MTVNKLRNTVNAKSSLHLRWVKAKLKLQISLNICFLQQYQLELDVINTDIGILTCLSLLSITTVGITLQRDIIW